MDALDGIDAKISRAKEVMGTLSDEWQSYLERKPCRLVREELEDGLSVARVRIYEAPPLRFGVLAGDILHSLRSALDHLAWQLVLANKGTPGKWTYFPVLYADNEADLIAKTKGMEPGAVREVRLMQPFANPPASEHPLHVLHRLDIRDKHRVVNIVGHVIADIQPQVLGPYVEFVHIVAAGAVIPIVDGMELMRVRNATVHLLVRFYFMFEDPRLLPADPPVALTMPFITTLNWLIVETRAVVDHLSPFAR